MEQSGMEYQDTLVVGRVNHHSVELGWAGAEEAGGLRLGPPETWSLFTLEMEDPRKHTFTTVYTGYGSRFTVEDLAPSSLYKFRLKTSGEILHSQDISVSTTREPINGRSLHQAVRLNDLHETTRILHMNIVDLNAPDRMGFTPLMVATMRGFFSLVDVLVQNGADVNKKNGSGKDSLMLACFCGHLDIVRYLRARGAVWNAQDEAGCTALHWAVDGSHLPVIQHMIKDGCQVDVKDSMSGWTPLMRVSAISGNAEVASLLLQAGANVNMRDRDGKTPLMIAVLNNREDLVKLLLENGADHRVKNEFGNSATEMAKAFERQSGKCYQSIMASIERLSRSFYPQAIRLLNWNPS